MVAFAWIIDRDLIDGGRMKGACWQNSSDSALPAQLKSTPSVGKKFRLLDGDDIVYFEGRFLSGDAGPGGMGEEYFAPLDWAEGSYGCTSIQYLNDRGQWETL